MQGVECIQRAADSEANYSYFPILVRPSYRSNRDQLLQRLKDRGVIARRYFHPLISEFGAYRDLPSAASKNLPVATEVARQVLCLPIHPRLGAADVRRVIDIVAGD